MKPALAKSPYGPNYPTRSIWTVSNTHNKEGAWRVSTSDAFVDIGFWNLEFGIWNLEY
tara:strand:- start:404 stop:577 length:174 start_codon:yes stop_codon:yes gene_type:complete